MVDKNIGLTKYPGSVIKNDSVLAHEAAHGKVMVAMVKRLTLTTVTRTYVGSNPTSHPIYFFSAA